MLLELLKKEAIAGRKKKVGIARRKKKVGRRKEVCLSIVDGES